MRYNYTLIKSRSCWILADIAVVMLLSYTGVSSYLPSTLIAPSVLSSYFSSTLSTPTPEYIKDVVAYKEGEDGLVVYVILADAAGAMTAAPGEITLQISSEGAVKRSIIGDYYFQRLNIAATAFRKTTVGLGAFERPVVLVSFGRIPYESFLHPPSGGNGHIEITFVTQNGRTLKGHTTLTF